MKVLLLVLLCLYCINASVWKDDFTQAVNLNPNLDQANTVEMKWDGATSYEPTKDPETVDPVLQDIIGMYSMDFINATDQTTPDLSPSRVTATINGNCVTIPGKFGNAIHVLDGYGNYIAVDPSPMTTQHISTTGFSVSMWFMPKNMSDNYRIMEKIYDSFDLQIQKQSATMGKYSCSLRDINPGNVYRAYGPSMNLTFNTWTHLACAYDPSSFNLTLYINGSLAGSAFANLTSGIYSKPGTILTLGTRPTISPSPPSKALDCAFDEVIFYGKVLSAANALSLYRRTEAVVPYPGPSFRSLLIKYTAGTSYWGFTPAWGTTSGSASDLDVEITTNRGITWCNVTNKQHFGDDQLCRLPAANIMYRVTIRKNLALDYIQFTYDDAEPQRPWRVFPVGINRFGTDYYATNKMFKDAQKTAATLPGTFNYDANRYPTNVTASVGYGIQFEDNTNYTLFAKGNGTITVKLHVGPTQTIHVPQDVPKNLTLPTAINIVYSVAPNYISDIEIVPTQFVSDYKEDPFWPVYIERFQDFPIVRYMDAMETNGNNIAHWSDRPKPGDWSQHNSIRTPNVIITSITMPPDGSPDVFAGKWSALVTTATPHNYVTGQSVTIAGTDAMVTAWTFNGNPMGNFSLNMNAHVSVASPTTFWFIFGEKDWHMQHWYYDQTTVTFQSGTMGTTHLSILAGVALEILVQAAATQNSHPWFNIPHLADDDYVQNFATFLKNSVDPKYKIYVEYSNEMWNTGFAQTDYIASMGEVYNISAQQFIAKRLVQIWKIFSDVYGSEFYRIVKLVPGWSGGGANWNEAILIALQDPTFNPYGFKPDVLTIAPYFSGSVAEKVVDQMNTITTDEILDMMRDAIYTDTASSTQSNAKIAQRHDVSLVAYEGGSHLLAGIAHTSDAYDNLTRVLTSTNRQPRMKDLIKQMFWQWSLNGGSDFVYYADEGSYTKWGSWGLFESADQPVNISYKYQAVKEVQQIYGSTQPVYPPGQTTSGQATNGQSTSVPSTNGQSTNVPSTNGQSTNVPSTNGQSTNVPSTNGQSTNVPSTNGQSTNVPSTNGQSTNASTIGNVPPTTGDQISSSSVTSPAFVLFGALFYLIATI